jgi:hypothetical protein
VCHRAASSRTPGIQVAALGERGEAARALGTTMAAHATARSRLAAGQPSRTGGRRDALESQGACRSGLAADEQNNFVCRPGLVPSRFLQVSVQDAAP